MVALAAAMIVSGCSFGWLFPDVRVTVENATGTAVTAFYTRETGQSEWGANLLAQELADAGTVDLIVADGNYDFRATVAGNDYYLLAIDLTGLDAYTLSIGGEGS